MKPYSFRGRPIRGMTLIELVIAVVIIGVAFAGMMAAYSSIMARSSDPLIYQQSIAIADSFMEEIASKSYPTSFAGACPAAPASRELFENVCDFAGYSSASITDVAGNAIGLNGYSVAVNVTAAGGDLGLSANNALRVEVSVSHPLGGTLSLTGYRTPY